MAIFTVRPPLPRHPHAVRPALVSASEDSHAGDQEAWPDDTQYDRLIGDWHFYQRKGGHRTSTDDLLVAWFATLRAPRPVRRYLDLGCGIGSVLLMTAHQARPEMSVGVEAQSQSVLMARRSLQELPEAALPIEIHHSDFRRFETEPTSFDLITASPPYFPLGSGGLPGDAQRRACRFEERGGVEEYCKTAARLLAEQGRLYLVFQTTWDQRVIAAASKAGLTLHARADVEARAGREPFLSVYEFAWAESASVEQHHFAVRDLDGQWTAEFLELRRAMGYKS